MTSAIKRRHNLQPPLVMFLHYLTLHKNGKVMLSCLPLSSVSGSKRNMSSCIWSDSEPVVWLGHSECSKWRPFALAHVWSRVCHWLRRWCPEKYGPKYQWTYFNQPI